MIDRSLRRVFLIVLLWLAASSPASALEWRTGSVSCRVGCISNPAAYAAGSPFVTIVPADGWGLGQFHSGGGRSRIVQICVVAMGIALFIMMKKLNG